MEAPPLERKLAAILAADVEGYSRLMNVDEEQTLATLTSHRALVDGLIEKAHGQIFGTAGDSVLAEFPSTVHAFHSGVAIQQAMWRANQALPEDRQMNFRIGINVGDVLVKNGDIFGDGVNIAAGSSPNWPRPVLKTADLANTTPASKSPSGRPCETRAIRK